MSDEAPMIERPNYSKAILFFRKKVAWNADKFRALGEATTLGDFTQKNHVMIALLEKINLEIANDQALVAGYQLTGMTGELAKRTSSFGAFLDSISYRISFY